MFIIILLTWIIFFNFLYYYFRGTLMYAKLNLSDGVDFAYTSVKLVITIMSVKLTINNDNIHC